MGLQWLHILPPGNVSPNEFFAWSWRKYTAHYERNVYDRHQWQFAICLGKWTDLPTLGAKQPQWRVPTQKLKAPPNQGVDPLLHHIDQFGKLAANFNNLQMWPTEQDPYEHWTSFSPEQKENDSDGDSVEEQDPVEFIEPDDRQMISTEARPTQSWWDYRRNLTYGFMEDNIFSVPTVD